MADPLDDDDEATGGGTATKDGEKQSIKDRAANGDGDDPQAQLPGVAPLTADKQLTLAGLGPRGMAIASEVSVMSAAVPTKGLLDPDVKGQILMDYLPRKYEYVPEREGGSVKRWTLRQVIRPTNIVRVGGVEAIQATVAAAVQKGESPDAIQKAVNDALAEALRQ